MMPSPSTSKYALTRPPGVSASPVTVTSVPTGPLVGEIEVINIGFALTICVKRSAINAANNMAEVKCFLFILLICRSPLEFEFSFFLLSFWLVSSLIQQVV